MATVTRFKYQLDQHRWYRGHLAQSIRELKMEYRVLACQMWPTEGKGIRLSVLLKSIEADDEGEYRTQVVDAELSLDRALSAARMILGEF